MFVQLAFLLVFLLVLFPAVFYLIVWVCLRVLKSPRRVLIALWTLDVVVTLVQESANLTVIVVVAAVLLSPLLIAMQFAILWVAGSLWRLVGWSTLGDRFRNMAKLHFRSLRPAKGEMT